MLARLTVTRMCPLLTLQSSVYPLDLNLNHVRRRVPGLEKILPVLEKNAL